MAKTRKDNKGRTLRKGETQRKNGSYVYTYTDLFQNRKYIYSKDLMRLREKEQQVLRDTLDGIDLYQAGRVTLDDMFDRYMSSKYELKEGTAVSYHYQYNAHVRGNFGKRLLSDIRYSDVKFFYLHLIRDKGMKASSVATIHRLLHPTFEFAVRDGIIRKNPTDGIMSEISKISDKTESRHSLTLEQQRIFLNYVSESCIYRRWMTLFAFLLGTGCRIGEALGLRWEDVDFDNRTISINHSLRYYTVEKDGVKHSALHVYTPKSVAGVREIPMLEEVYGILRDEYECQSIIGFCRDEIDGMSGFIFFNTHGNVHIPSSVNQVIYRIRDSYNTKEEKAAKKEKRDPVLLPNISCHILRHTFCTRLCEYKSNLKVIQSIMGHADVKMTMNIYAEATADKKKEIMDDLSHNLKLF